MLKRIYIDNYRCMVNFDFAPKSMQLILGLNGTGKSSVFDALSCLREFVTKGRATTELFPPESLTRWQTRHEQTFEIELEGNGGLYQYRLVIDHKLETRECRVHTENLTFDVKPLYLYADGEANLYRDDHSEGPHFPIDWSRSGMFGIPPRHDNRKLTWFKDRVSKLFVLRINPVSMRSRTEAEASYPEGDLSNFVSWYRNLSQEAPSSVHDLFESLKEIIDGFSFLKLVPDGEQGRVLRMQVKAEPENEGRQIPLDFRFDELSDGERVLTVLYTLLHCAVGPDATLCIDEPGNYLTLQEIQPWLMALKDRIAETNSQAIILSHNPEIIDYLAAQNAAKFERVGAGPVRVREFLADPESGLSASELIARGWDNGKA